MMLAAIQRQKQTSQNRKYTLNVAHSIFTYCITKAFLPPSAFVRDTTSDIFSLSPSKSHLKSVTIHIYETLLIVSQNTNHTRNFELWKGTETRSLFPSFAWIRINLIRTNAWSSVSVTHQTNSKCKQLLEKDNFGRGFSTVGQGGIFDGPWPDVIEIEYVLQGEPCNQKRR